MPFWNKKKQPEPPKPQYPAWYPPGTTEDTLFKYIIAANPDLDEDQKTYQTLMNGKKTLREINEKIAHAQKTGEQYHRELRGE